MTDAEAFERFFMEAQPLLLRALVSRFGPELGREAAAEGFAVAWRVWGRISSMENRPGYVYRTAERWAFAQTKKKVGQSAVREVGFDRYGDHDLVDALELLSPKQRQAVVLVEGYGLSHREAAELLGCGRSSIQNHVERGLKRLRQTLEVDDHA